MQTIVISVIIIPWMIILYIVLSIILGILVKKVINTIREATQLFYTSRSPLISFLQESIAGASTIRSFGRTQEFLDINETFLNDNIVATKMMSGVNSWFSIRVNTVVIVLLVVITFSAILLRDKFDAVMLSLMISYAFIIQFILTNFLKIFLESQQQVVNADRCMRLTDIIQEEKIDFSTHPDLLHNKPHWPNHGLIEF